MKNYFEITVNLSKKNVAEHGAPNLQAMQELNFQFKNGQLGQYATLRVESLGDVSQYWWRQVAAYAGPITGWHYDGVTGDSFNPRREMA